MPHAAHLDVPYVPNPHTLQHLDLYTPTPTSPSPPTPLIIYIHGGAFKHGTRRSTETYFPRRLLLTQPHSALASLSYRLSPDATFPAALLDCRAAIRFLRAHAANFNLDPSRFAVYGESAGGHMATMLGLTSDSDYLASLDLPVASFPDDGTGGISDASVRVQGVVTLYGPSDFSQMDRQAIPDGRSLVHDGPGTPEALYLGADITTVPWLVARANPVAYTLGAEVLDSTSKGMGEKVVIERTQYVPPFFIAHGEEDHVVPFGQSVVLRDALGQRREDGGGDGRAGEVVFVAVENADHCFEGAKGEDEEGMFSGVDRFLERCLGIVEG